MHALCLAWRTICRVFTPRGLETEAGHTFRALVKEVIPREVPVHPPEGWRGCGASEEEKQTHGFGSLSFAEQSQL